MNTMEEQMEEITRRELRDEFYGKHVHDFIGSIQKEATCIEEGIMLYQCECGEDSYTVPIPSVEHQYEEKSVTKNWNVIEQTYAWYNTPFAANVWRLASKANNSGDSTKFTSRLIVQMDLNSQIDYPINFKTNALSNDIFAIFLDQKNVYQLNGSNTNQNGKNYSVSITIPEGSHQLAFMFQKQGTGTARYVNLMDAGRYVYTDIQTVCKICGNVKE